MFVHAGDELIEMCKYLVLGAFLTACIQSFIPREELLALGNGPAASLSVHDGICHPVPLLNFGRLRGIGIHAHLYRRPAGFLPGPRPDAGFQNLLMLSATFKTKFVIGLSLLVITLVFIGSVASTRYSAVRRSKQTGWQIHKNGWNNGTFRLLCLRISALDWRCSGSEAQFEPAKHYILRSLLIAALAAYIMHLNASNSLDYYLAPHMQTLLLLLCPVPLLFIAFGMLWHAIAGASGEVCDCEHPCPAD